MLIHARAVFTPHRVPSAPSLQPPEPWTALLDNVGGIEDEEHVIVLGTDGPDLMCALLRAGARQVTHLRSHERLEVGSASLIIVPEVASATWLRGALASIRRALVPNGRLLVSVDPLASAQNRVPNMLRLQAFAAIRRIRAAGRSVLSAEVPAYSVRRCA